MTTLAVRLDNDGDVLLTGPAVRALAAHDDVDLLAGPSGAGAARLLPGVREVLVVDAPWSGYRPPAVDPAAIDGLVATLAARRYDRAVVFTSFHQSPLPMALLAKLAGIGHVSATSVDYPGSLLDVRHQRPEGLHEVEAALDLARAAGAQLPPGDDGRLAVRRPLPDATPLLTDSAPLPAEEQLSARREGSHPLPATPLPAESSLVTGGAPLVQEQLSARRRGEYVVLHPGASVPARAIAPEHARAIAGALVAAGWDVVVTGGPGEQAPAAGPGVHDLTGRTDLPQLAAVLDGAACVVVGNTGPAHLAAAVGTPVVSLFSPVVPAERWAPYGVPTVVLGDQLAACADTRARECPVPGHPCLTGIRPEQVVDAVASLAPQEVMA
ncbi:ADP-heptose:LPS heptosyltransferase [Georgenia satyanarayanai]|uniref:ADP-heptose:LPS heptosyltransferase n=1 Tax=Georgenia satyanarayanai TaxID=860221 RepID=A0A2Y9BZ92_9MICO|nr:glycosyltransferase family 9 protein [Georgenia satyanarayanai]PYF98990.1 ADP-heptose:LPS heptosyltransferase [Georgenia satyanarayanai]SSA43952.1 ADP-heptose:LPS heptosyltransferase [Georgenia satyanarayanai]